MGEAAEDADAAPPPIPEPTRLVRRLTILGVALVLWLLWLGAHTPQLLPTIAAILATPLAVFGIMKKVFLLFFTEMPQLSFVMLHRLGVCHSP